MNLKEYLQKPPKKSIAYFTSARPMYKPIEKLFFKRSKKMEKFFKDYKINDKKYFWEIFVLAKPKNMPQEFSAKIFHNQDDAREYVRQAKKQAKELGFEIVIFTVVKEATITEKI